MAADAAIGVRQSPTAPARMLRKADHYLGMTDHDWRVDVAAELDALLHNWGGPER